MNSDGERFFLLNAMEVRAASWVYSRIGAHRQELEVMAGLDARLRLSGKERISRREFIRWLGCSLKTAKKYKQYLWACGERGMVKISRGEKTGMEYYELTILGKRVLDAYWEKMEELEGKARAKLSAG